MSDSSVWAGLGARADAASPLPPPDVEVEDGQDDFARKSIQRTVDARNAPSVIPAGARTSAFDHPFPPAPGSASEQDNDNAADEEKPVRKSKPRNAPDAPTRRDLQRVVCAHLLAGAMSRAGLAEAEPSLNGTQLSNVLFNASALARIQRCTLNSGGNGWQLTRAGRAWLSDHVVTQVAAPSKATRKAAKSEAPATVKRAARKAKVAAPEPMTAVATALTSPAPIAVRQAQVVVERSFRCGVFNDGGFHLAKGGAEVTLDADECAQMLRYLERMVEQPGA